MVAIITGRGPVFTQRLHRQRTAARAPSKTMQQKTRNAARSFAGPGLPAPPEAWLTTARHALACTIGGGDGTAHTSQVNTCEGVVLLQCPGQFFATGVTDLIPWKGQTWG